MGRQIDPFKVRMQTLEITREADPNPSQTERIIRDNLPAGSQLLNYKITIQVTYEDGSAR